MIFITVGTTAYPFYRMNGVFEQMLLHRKKRELIIYQHGATPVFTDKPNVQLCPSTTFNKMISNIKQSRIIIAHGGPATIFQCLSLSKKPLVLPREKQFGEHVNDHQVLFSRYLAKQNKILLIRENEINIKIYNNDSIQYYNNSIRSLEKYLENITNPFV
jgi:UDP-N-acetylglucosamine transferase subunit ALG13